MENLQLSVRAVLPMFLIIAAGMLSGKFKVLCREEVPRFNRVAFRVFFPCLLFDSIYRSDLSEAVKPRLILFAVGGVLLVFAAAVLAARYLEPHPERKGVVAQAIFRSNYVIMGLPIAEALVGKENLGTVSVLIAIIVPLFNFLSVLVLESFRGESFKPGKVLAEIAKNPLIVGSVLGILCLLFHLRLPRLLEEGIRNLGSIGTPLQLFLLGAFFDFGGLRRYWKVITAVTLTKLLLTPGIMLGCAAALGFRGVDFVALIGIFASPTAVNSFTMVQQMHCGDAELAGDLVISTSAFSMLSLFFWIFLFKSLGVF